MDIAKSTIKRKRIKKINTSMTYYNKLPPLGKYTWILTPPKKN